MKIFFSKIYLDTYIILFVSRNIMQKKYGQSKIFQDKEHHDSSRKGFRFLVKGFQKLSQLICVEETLLEIYVARNIQSIGKNCFFSTNAFEIETTRIGSKINIHISCYL